MVVDGTEEVATPLCYKFINDGTTIGEYERLAGTITERPLGSYTARRFLRTFRSSATSSATAEAISEVLDILSSPSDVLVSMYVQKTAGVVSIG